MGARRALASGIGLFVGVALLAPTARAAGTVGWLDPTFGTRGVVAVPTAAAMRSPFALVGAGASGRIAVIATYTTSRGGSRQELTVFTGTGRIDGSFHGGRLVAVSTDPSGECCGVDGPFVTADNGVDVGLVAYQDLGVVRYSPAGSRTWQGGWIVAAGSVNAVLAGGSPRGLGRNPSPDVSNPTPQWLLGLTPSGAPDTRVGPNGIRVLAMDSGPNGLVADALNRLYVLGNEYGNPLQLTDRSIVASRLTSSGALDTTYGVGGAVTIPVDDSDNSPVARPGGGLIALAPDGSLFIAGEATSTTSTKGVVVVRKLDPSGAIDSAFGAGGLVEVPGATGSSRLFSLAVDHGGNPILSVLERGSPSRPALVRLDGASGALDPSFGDAGVIHVAGLVTDLAIDPSGRLLAVSRVAKDGAFVLYLSRRSI